MPNNELHTPVPLARRLSEAVGGFDLDPASGCEPETIATMQYTEDVDGLTQDWYGKTFVNPPYERYVIDDWADEIDREAARDDGPRLIVTLVPARVNTDWWHVLTDDADIVALLNNRLRFGDYESTGRYPYAIVVHGEWIPDALLDAIEEESGEYEGAALSAPADIPRIRDVGIGTEIDIRLDDRPISFPEHVDPSVTASVVASRETERGVIEVMTVATHVDGSETYYLLHQPADDPTEVRCAVDNRHLQGWREVPVEAIETASSRDGPSPFGYVA